MEKEKNISRKSHDFQFFLDRITGYFDKKILSFFSVYDLDVFISQRYEFIRQKLPEDEIKLSIINHGVEDYHANKTTIELLCDDQEYLVDSFREFFKRKGLDIFLVAHPTLTLSREIGSGELVSLQNGNRNELYIYLEVKQLPQEELQLLANQIKELCSEIRLVVQDWQTLSQKLFHDREHFFPAAKKVSDLLEWILDHNMIVLGAAFLEDRERSFGILRSGKYRTVVLDVLNRVTEAFLQQKKIQEYQFFCYHSDLVTSVDKNSELVFLFLKGVNGWFVILGDFTINAKGSKIDRLPIVSDIFRDFLRSMGSRMGNHSLRTARTIFNLLPLEIKFTLPLAGYEEVFQFLSQVYFYPRLTINISWFGERRALLICTVPEHLFQSTMTARIKELCQDFFLDSEIRLYVQFETAIVKIFLMIHLFHSKIAIYRKDSEDFSNKVIRELQGWDESMRILMQERFSTPEARYFSGYLFDWNYKNNSSVQEAILDLENSRLLNDQKYSIRISRDNGDRILRILATEPLNLSDMLPVLSSFGLQVGRETTASRLADSVFVYLFQIVNTQDIPNEIQFCDALLYSFLKIIPGDMLNSVLLSIDIHWNELMILKAMRAYILQTMPAWSHYSITGVLLRYFQFSMNLVYYMRAVHLLQNATLSKKIANELQSNLELAKNVSEDQIMRQLLGVVLAIQRCNCKEVMEKIEKKFFRIPEDYYLSVKIASLKIPYLPKPRPMFEIFVFAPHMRGIHLRGDKVARGGIRWSDRSDDLRLEILGLMKTQMVKNAVIVPSGSKGGFVIDKPSLEKSELQNQAVLAYQTLIQGMLDLSDNYDAKDEKCFSGVRLDSFDPYLVVAADKGTANFSDIANQISSQKNFWLGDAFASGGSSGYNHKSFGITARGAWESVKRHFYNLGISLKKEFSVIGIGDMSGDVFGNGMIYSDRIRLIAAFNHSHIFLDPNTDATISFAERVRLFHEGKGGWEHYNRSLISKGGGVFAREERSIPISPEVQDALGIKESALSGPELIQYILKAPIDLFLNGGIGTYIKASDEANQDVGDKANDAVRISATDLRAKVVAEGGNLGFTQKARIEYAQKGGSIFTDALDNSGGVDMSDHEVNIKIALAELLHLGRIKNQQRRNQVLDKIGQSVALHVLQNNFSQALAVSVDFARSRSMGTPFIDVIEFLELKKLLDSRVEQIPDRAQLLLYREKGIPKPILALLFGYAKIFLKKTLLENPRFQASDFSSQFLEYFPDYLVKNYGKDLFYHKLHREITATVLTNQLINFLGSAALVEIATNSDNAITSVYNFFALDSAVNGKLIRKNLFGLQEDVAADIFEGRMIALSSSFQNALAFLSRRQVAISKEDVTVLKILLTKLFENGRLSSGDVITGSSVDIPFQSALGLMVVVMFLYHEKYRSHDIPKKVRQRRDNRSNSLIENRFASFFTLYQQLRVEAYFAAIYRLRAVHPWERSFRQRLIMILENYLFDFFDKIMAYTKYKLTLHDSWVAQWFDAIPGFRNIEAELNRPDQDFLSLEHLIQSSFGVICDEQYDSQLISGIRK